MMKSKKYLWTAVLVTTVVLALLLAGCGPGGTELTYRVTGTASEATIKYTNADGELEETTVNLPWETTLNVGNEFRFTLEVINLSGSGTVTGEALVDGGYLGKADGNTSVYCSGYFSKKGDSLTSAFSSAVDTVAPPATPTPSASEHMDLGMEYYEQGQFDKAIAEFKAAIELEPDNAETHANLGAAYGEQGRLDEGIAQLKEALRINPDHATAHYNLGFIYTKQDKPEEAIAECKEALRLKPEYDDAHNCLGIAYAKQGEVDEAIAEWKEAIRINPDHDWAHYNLGLAYVNQGKLDEAIAEWEETIRINPDHNWAHSNLGLAYAEQGKMDEAITEYQEAIRINADDAIAHNNLGFAYYKQGKLDEAIAEYKEAIKIDPDHAMAHINLGLAHRDLGQAEEAIAAFKAYLQLRPDAPDRAAVEQDIAKLKESAAGQVAEYRHPVGGYSLLYPEGWYYTEDEAQVIFAESEEALEAAPEKAPMVMFIAGPLSEIAESLDLEEITDPVVALEAMAENLEAEMGEVETGKLAGYPAALTGISGTFQGVSYQGDLLVALVEKRAVYGVALAPPDQWEAFRPTFVDMLNSLSFFEP